MSRSRGSVVCRGGIVGVEDVLESRSAVGVVVGEGALRRVLR